MARILVNGGMIRFPMGGINLWIITWLVGLKRHGHDVYMLENTGWENACFDARRGIMTNDCGYGIEVVSLLLEQYGLKNNWSFIDFAGEYHGLSRHQVDELFRTADAFFDFEWSALHDRTSHIPIRVFIDSEPGWFQMRREMDLEAGKKLREYDHFYTDGLNIGSDFGSAPTGGIEWRHFLTPALLDHAVPESGEPTGRFTTIMGWKSNNPVEYKGQVYGQKDLEFEKFMELPRHLHEEIEVAVSGDKVPRDRLTRNGWIVRNANQIARSVDTYREYIARSKGEFSVAKNVFVETQCGWWGDRAGVFMSYGKPVVLQDSGFSKYLPCGEGLFAVHNVEEAAEAISEINTNYRRHSRAARELAEQYLSVEKVVGKMLKEVGLN